ncbi:hypothetical protein ACEOHO_004242 [Vibrio vulnificus]|nr:hypothetical protein [Vibrio vulnificus]ELH7807795.1 hypothetical protein [Vibrio vulnificus]
MHKSFDLKELQDIAEMELDFKEVHEYISDETNRRIVSSYSDNLEKIHEVSNRLVLSKVERDLSPAKAIFEHGSDSLNALIKDNEIKLEKLNKDLSGKSKYQAYLETNNDIKKIDKIHAYTFMAWYLFLLFITSITELSWAGFMLKITASTYSEGSLVASMGGIGYIIGLIPTIIMCTGFFAEKPLINYKVILVLEGIWVTFYTLVFSVFGSITVAETLTMLVRDTVGISLDFSSVLGVLTYVSQTMLLTGVGHLFALKAGEYYRSTRLSQLSENNDYKVIQKELCDFQEFNSTLIKYLGTIKGKLNSINHFTLVVVGDNEANLAFHIQKFQSIQVRRDHAKALLLAHDSERNILEDAYINALAEECNYLCFNEKIKFLEGKVTYEK